MPKAETNEIGQPMINGGSFRGEMEMIIRKEKKKELCGNLFHGMGRKRLNYY